MKHRPARIIASSVGGWQLWVCRAGQLRRLKQAWPVFTSRSARDRSPTHRDCVAPGFIDTEYDHPGEEARAKLVRMAAESASASRDIANAVAFLPAPGASTSPASRHVIVNRDVYGSAMHFWPAQRLQSVALQTVVPMTPFFQSSRG